MRCRSERHRRSSDGGSRQAENGRYVGQDQIVNVRLIRSLSKDCNEESNLSVAGSWLV